MRRSGIDVNGSWNSSNLLLSVTGLVSFSLSPIFLFSDFQARKGRGEGGTYGFTNTKKWPTVLQYETAWRICSLLMR